MDEIEPEEDFDPLDEINTSKLPAARQKGRFECDECQMICRSRYLLERHEKARHHKKQEKEVPKSCPYCGKGFASMVTRLIHMAQCAWCHF